MDLNLGRLGFVDQGNYSAGTAYKKRDVVTFTDGNTYRAIADTVAGESPTSAPAKWLKMASGIQVMTTNGDLIWHDGAGAARLPVGSQGQVLTVGAAGALQWGTGSKFLKSTYFVDRARRNYGNVARYEVFSATLNRVSTTSMIIGHIAAPGFSDTAFGGNGSGYMQVNNLRRHSMTAHGPGPSNALGTNGVCVWTPAELGTTTGNMTCGWGWYSYDSGTGNRFNIANPTNSDDSRNYPDTHAEQNCTTMVFYEIEP